MPVRLSPLFLLSACLILAAGLLSPEGLANVPSICPFRILTDLDCPGCGLFRSWSATLHFRWSDAFALHPFGPPTVIGLMGALIAAPSGQSFDAWLSRLWRDAVWIRRLSWLGAAIWFAWAVARVLRQF